jgi:phosphomannomutase
MAITFGTDGWRALIADEFTFANVRLVTQAIATYLDSAYDKSLPVLIGHDTRFLAPEFAQAAAQVMMATGRPVLMPAGHVPTPVIAHAAQAQPTAGALMFTASHNPPNYCGIKYIPDYAGPATAAITDAIVSEVRRLEPIGVPAPAGAGGTAGILEPQPAYEAAILKLLDVDRLRAFTGKVAYDAMYGTGQGFADRLLRRLLPSEVIVLRDRRDVLFGGGMPEPGPRYLTELAETVRQQGCAVGLANDGDADRFGVMDGQGQMYTPNQVIALLARHLVKNKGQKGAIVRTVATTHLLDRLAAHYGVPLVETAVGFKHVGEAMRQQAVLIGGEESGGLSVLGHIPEKDGILADLLVVEMLAYEQKPLAAVWEDLVREVGLAPVNQRLDLRLTEGAKVRLLERLRAEAPSQVDGLPVTGVNRIDGTKLNLGDSAWMLVRPSGTEPLVRVYLEADTSARLASLVRAATELVESLAGEPAQSGHH